MKDTVVIVDDVPGVLDFTCEMLRDRGVSSILTFSDPATAYQEIARSGCPAWVITDYNMPEINGVMLLNRLGQLYPDLKGIIITSDPQAVEDNERSYRVVEKGSREFLEMIMEVGEGDDLGRSIGRDFTCGTPSDD